MLVSEAPSLSGATTDKQGKSGNQNPDHWSYLTLRPPFAIEMSGHKVIPASALKIVGQARVEHLEPNPAASRYLDRLPGVAVHYALTDEAGQFTADWAVVLRQGSSYIRQVLTIKSGTGAGAAALPVSAVTMIDVKAAGVALTGSVKGSPLTLGNVFLGIESPLSLCGVQTNEGFCRIESGVPIAAGLSETYSAVIGVAAPGQMRRDFLAYIEQERAHPYRTFLHYNSWFDIGYGNRFDEADALDRIHAFGEELVRSEASRSTHFSSTMAGTTRKRSGTSAPACQTASRS